MIFELDRSFHGRKPKADPMAKRDLRAQSLSQTVRFVTTCGPNWLTRWMLEVRAGVFVGTLSARVRAKLWALVCRRNHQGGSLLIYRSPNEQGFMVETHGDTSRSIVDIEGLLLVRRPLEAPRAPSDPRPKE